MTWLDVVAILIILAVGVVQTLRGFGRAMFDALALYGVVRLAPAVAVPLSHFVQVSANDGMNEACAYTFVAVLGGVLALAVSRYCYVSLQPNAGMFDHFLGLVLGMVVGVMVCHMVMCGIAFTDPAGDGPTELVTSGFVSGEMYDFHTYHSFVDSFTNLTTGAGSTDPSTASQ